MRVCVAAMSFLVAAFSFSCTSREQGAPSQFQDEYRFEEVKIPLQDGPTLFAKLVGYGPDTVIIPAAMYLANDFRPLVHGRTLIFYDPRGRGGSDYVGDPNQLGIEFDVADLEAVRQHFAVDRFSVIGWSYLGAMVVLYAAEHPEHVNRVVQIGPMEPRPVADLGDEREPIRRLSPQLQRTALRKLLILDAAEQLADLRLPPGNRLEKLKGDRAGQHSIRINEQWRVCFRWRDGNAYEVEIADYH